MPLIIELLDSSKHKRSAFNCGNNSLNNYLQRQASQDLKRKLATVFVLIDSPSPDIIAYYTLSSYTVEIEELNDRFAKGLPRYPKLPATLIGRLAVAQKSQGQGIGEFMLIDALKKALLTSKQIASLAVVVEAIDSKAVNFYRKYGFEQFNQHPMKLYLPMKSIEQLSI